MPPGSPDIRPALSQWASLDTGADIEALDALETYKKKDPSKGARVSPWSTRFVAGLTGHQLYFDSGDTFQGGWECANHEEQLLQSHCVEPLSSCNTVPEERVRI